jgi:membrane protease YdiL (CAAX protease family)
MNEPVEGFDWNDRVTFLRAGVVVEVIVLLVGLGLGWLVGINPWRACQWTPAAIAWGVAATGPLLLAFGVTYTVPWAPVRRIRELLIELLGRPMARCRWHDLVVLAVLAGVCEEVLFRGVIQPWMAGHDAARPLAIGFVVALLGSNLLFGLLHPVTRTYAVLVGLVGMYLGLVGLVDPLPEGSELAGQGNLVVPMIAHGLYDFLAFLVIAGECRRRERAGDQTPPVSDI